MVCVVYRFFEIGIVFLVNEFMFKYMKVLLFNKEIVVIGDVNCDLLVKNLKGDVLFLFCVLVNVI